MENTKNIGTPGNILDETQEVIAHNIKQLLSFSGLDQTEFGKIAETNNKNVSNWANKVAMPPIHKLILICRHFDLTMDELVTKKLRVEIETRLTNQ